MRSSSAGELRGKVVMIDRRVAEHLHLVFGGKRPNKDVVDARLQVLQAAAAVA